MQFLMFRLYGPMASWGEIAVGESRHTAAYPGKSALLGLLAAALGITRSDELMHQEMAAEYRFGVKVISTGHLLRDYHTTQVPDAVGKAQYHTRRDEIVKGKSRLGTSLSSREYRCDALFIVAAGTGDNPPFGLEELSEALLNPRFHLYLGRKSCPLAAPLNPRIVEAQGLSGAFDAYKHGALHLSSAFMYKAEAEAEAIDASGLSPLLSTSAIAAELSRVDRYALQVDRQPVRYYWEGDAGDLTAQQILMRNDQPLSRSRWQFAQREEHLTIVTEES